MTINKKKKICYICHKVYPGPNFEYLSRIVSKSGYDVSMVLLSETGEDQIDHQSGRKIHRFNIPSIIRGRKRDLSFISKTIDILNRENFSIVHMHSSCKYFALYKMLSKSNAKFIYHSLSYPLSFSRVQRKYKMLFIYFQCLFMERVIFQTEEAKQHWIGFRNFKKADIVPVGFDKNVLHPITKDKKRHLRKQLNICESHPLLVFCGAISKFRQIDQLIKAFEKVHTIVENAKLMIIGDGNDLEHLKSLAKNSNLNTSIIFTGRVPHELLSNYIAMADIGLSYVPINENYTYNPPLKTFEYLACGLPTIATKTDSNCKILTDGFNGILVGDMPEDLSISIIDLLKNKEKQMWLVKNARESIMPFDFSHIAVTNLVPLYDRLLSKE